MIPQPLADNEPVNQISGALSVIIVKGSLFGFSCGGGDSWEAGGKTGIDMGTFDFVSVVSDFAMYYLESLVSNFPREMPHTLANGSTKSTIRFLVSPPPF